MANLDLRTLIITMLKEKREIYEGHLKMISQAEDIDPQFQWRLPEMQKLMIEIRLLKKLLQGYK